MTGGGKRLTFNWQSSGATKARILSGAGSQRFPQVWEVPPSGSHVVELSATNYKDPMMTLSVEDDQGRSAIQDVRVAWSCRYEDVFGGNAGGAADSLRRYAPSLPSSAFERGTMIWVESVESEAVQPVIFVLYDDQTWAQFNDTFQDGEPESDPAIVPPAGYHQPTRGFGKLWRETSTVRERLGWALEQERGFQTLWQQQYTEAPPTVARLKNYEGKTFVLTGAGGSGTWKLE